MLPAFVPAVISGAYPKCHCFSSESIVISNTWWENTRRLISWLQCQLIYTCKWNIKYIQFSKIIWIKNFPFPFMANSQTPASSSLSHDSYWPVWVEDNSSFLPVNKCIFWNCSTWNITVQRHTFRGKSSLPSSACMSSHMAGIAVTGRWENMCPLLLWEHGQILLSWLPAIDSCDIVNLWTIRQTLFSCTKKTLTKL